MKKLQLDSKKIIIWLCVNYGIFVLAFLVLGTLGSEYKPVQVPCERQAAFRV